MSGPQQVDPEAPEAAAPDGGTRVTAAGLVGRIAIGVAILGLVAAALLLTVWDDGPDDRIEEAEARVAELYEAGSVGEARELLVDGSIEDDAQVEADVDELLAEVLGQPFRAEDSRVLRVGDTELVQVTVHDVPWCVRDDGGILLGCRVATAEVDAAPDTPDLTVIFADIDVLAHRVDAVVVVASETGDPIPIEGTPTMATPELVGGEWELTETSLVGAGQRVEMPLEMLNAYPDAGALFLFQGRDLDDLSAIGGETFTVSWEGVTVTAEVTAIEWHLE